MEVVGSEIGQKMRSAIKAKLTELGCYVDDELPDYVMVMVANKRTRSQMEEDLQLFLGDNTQLFVNWLHQVLKKLQEVTVAPLKPVETEPVKEKSKEKKLKAKKAKLKEKSKSKKTDSKKSKKKDKDKSRKKDEKKTHKSKKKSKKHEMIRPNIPPLLMNMEKESEPSITDVFAGQILKNHGITIDMPKIEERPDIKEKRPILPIIDPATILSQPEVQAIPTQSQTDTINSNEIDKNTEIDVPTSTQVLGAPRDEQIKEINEIEAKIQGLKQKLAEQLDSMSEDEDFLNIRTEAEELMNDFAEDVFQEISSQAPANPIEPSPPNPPEISLPRPIEIPSETPKEVPQEIPRELPETIELKLPKRPVRERLGAREEAVKLLEKTKLPEKKKTSPERLTPEPEPDFWGKTKSSARSRLGSQADKKKDSMSSDSSDESAARKRVKSSSSDYRRPGRSTCASVVVVKPRMRPQTSSLLLRAVADAQKSLLNIPPKPDTEAQKPKRALVRPMRRCVDNQKIVVQVPQRRDSDDKTDKLTLDTDNAVEYIPASLSRKFTNTDYVPSRTEWKPLAGENSVIDTINIHNTTVDKDKNTQFIVTMDGFNPNAFLAKKLMTEGLLNDEDELKDKPKTSSVLHTKPGKTKEKDVTKEKETEKKDDNESAVKENDTKIVDETSKKLETSTTDTQQSDTDLEIADEIQDDSTNEAEIEHTKIYQTASNVQHKRLSDTSDESDTQVIIKQDKVYKDSVEKRKSFTDSVEKVYTEVEKNTDVSKQETPPAKKKKRASPIVFDVGKKEKERQKERQREEDREKEKETEESDRKRERTESASSDNHVIITTAVNTKKYETVPPLSTGERKAAVWCRTFPLCKFGAACAFQHPRCKFAAACTRRNCVYAHDHAARPAVTLPVIASHVVPVANYKSISPQVMPSICRFYPNCTNTGCRFYHPKPCRFGSACVNKLECNFYHSDVKWRYPV